MPFFSGIKLRNRSTVLEKKRTSLLTLLTYGQRKKIGKLMLAQNNVSLIFPWSQDSILLEFGEKFLITHSLAQVFIVQVFKLLVGICVYFVMIMIRYDDKTLPICSSVTYFFFFFFYTKCYLLLSIIKLSNSIALIRAKLS